MVHSEPIPLSVKRRNNSNSSDDGSSSSCSIEANLRLHQQQQLKLGFDEPSPLSCFFSALARKKPLDCRTDTSLNRCLNLVDLTALGVGSTLGLGLYVLAGEVASRKAGPAVVISFALAALASAFSALCYAEFAGRVPKAGSAYAYSYITVGEFVAFVIGWNLILEYVIGAASVARGFSSYLRLVYNRTYNSLTSGGPQTEVLMQPPKPISFNNTINVTTSQLTGIVGNGGGAIIMNANATANSWFGESVISYLEEYFDWPSVAIIVAVTIFILLGVKGSTNVTLAFTSLNLLVVGVIISSSITSLDLNNWRLTKSQVGGGHGEGGFFPYGWSGVLAGSATCFFAFIGFDTIASSAEEAKNPKRNVPLSILLSLFISSVTYMAMAIVQTLIWPYYDQDNVTILPHIFENLRMPFTYWVVLLGAIAGLASSQLGGMYPLPRILYSMAHDKLIYGYLAHVNRRLKLPVRATIFGSLFVAVLSCLLDINQLVEMVSIGTLAAYSLVSLSVLILRYENRKDAVDDSTILGNHLAFTDIISSMDQSTGGDATIDQQKLAASDESRAITLNATKVSGKLAESQNNNHKKLSAKPSTPIREKGSKALSPKLSVGFQSWFKSQPDSLTPIATDCVESNPSRTGASQGSSKHRSYLDLLITWKADDQNREPDSESSRQSKILISLLVVLTIILDIVVLFLTNMPNDLDTSATITTGPISSQESQLQPFSIHPKLLLGSTGCIVTVVLAAVMLMLARLPTSSSIQQNDMFQVPLVPLIPTLSILVNTFLMLNLTYLTWVRFTVWMAIGLFIYFTYGIWNSEGFLLYLDR